MIRIESLLSSDTHSRRRALFESLSQLSVESFLSSGTGNHIRRRSFRREKPSLLEIDTGAGRELDVLQNLGVTARPPAPAARPKSLSRLRDSLE